MNRAVFFLQTAADGSLLVETGAGSGAANLSAIKKANRPADRPADIPIPGFPSSISRGTDVPAQRTDRLSRTLKPV